MPTPERRAAAVRAARILALAGLVQAIARKTGGPADFEDRVQDGTVGAIQAVDRWDGRGTLRGWASSRIRGAIRDGQRRDDWLTRGDRTRSKAAGLAPPRPSSADALAAHGDRWEPAADAPDVDAALDLRDAVARLPDREREMTVRHFWQDETAEAIAADFGVTESRVWQMLKKAQRRMRRTVER